MFSSVGVALMLASLGAAVRPEGEVVALILRGAVFAVGWALILAGPKRLVSVGYLAVVGDVIRAGSILGSGLRLRGVYPVDLPEGVRFVVNKMLILG